MKVFAGGHIYITHFAPFRAMHKMGNIRNCSLQTLLAKQGGTSWYLSGVGIIGCSPLLDGRNIGCLCCPVYGGVSYVFPAYHGGRDREFRW